MSIRQGMILNEQSQDCRHKGKDDSFVCNTVAVQGVAALCGNALQPRKTGKSHTCWLNPKAQSTAKVKLKTSADSLPQLVLTS